MSDNPCFGHAAFPFDECLACRALAAETERENFRQRLVAAEQARDIWAWEKDEALRQLAEAETRYVQLKAINDDNTKSYLDEICKHTETLQRLAAAEALATRIDELQTEVEWLRLALKMVRTKAREAWQITTREFAKACGVSPSQLCRWTAEEITEEPDFVD